MIDWVSCSLPYEGPPLGVRYLKTERRLDPVSGRWADVTEPAFNLPVQLEGSYSSKLKVQAMGGRLYISGNPVKWLTGQNVAGTDDLAGLIAATLDAVMERLDLLPCPVMLAALAKGDVSLTRVDCTFSYMVGSDRDVVRWLEAMEKACSVRFRGRGHFDRGMCCLMFGLKLEEGKPLKASRRSTFKFYNKWQEVGAHPMTCNAKDAEDLREQVWGTVRGEACYRGIELKRLKKDRLSAWTKETALELHREWVDRMELPDTFTLTPKDQEELPTALKATYLLWRDGHAMHNVLSKRTFYRHRRFLLEHGIDISDERPAKADQGGEVIPIIRVLEAKPMPQQDLEATFWRLVAAA